MNVSWLIPKRALKLAAEHVDTYLARGEPPAMVAQKIADVRSRAAAAPSPSASACMAELVLPLAPRTLARDDLAVSTAGEPGVDTGHRGVMSASGELAPRASRVDQPISIRSDR